MDIFFQDPSEVPLPPEDVRIRDIFAEPWPDGRRVRVYLEVDPFQQRPSAELVILNEKGEEVAQTSIVEALTRKMELNMHLSEANPAGAYTLKTLLYYDKKPQEDLDTDEQERPAPDVVDQGAFEFIIPEPGA
jgi:hypothetical protein